MISYRQGVQYLIQIQQWKSVPVSCHLSDNDLEHLLNIKTHNVAFISCLVRTDCSSRKHLRIIKSYGRESISSSLYTTSMAKENCLFVAPLNMIESTTRAFGPLRRAMTHIPYREMKQSTPARVAPHQDCTCAS